MNVPLLIAGRLRAWMMPIAIVAVVAITITFLVVPVRTFFTQRDLLETRGNQYGAYEEVNDALQDEVDALRLPAGVRAAIRSQLGYLLPDERRVPLLALPEAPRHVAGPLAIHVGRGHRATARVAGSRGRARQPRQLRPVASVTTTRDRSVTATRGAPATLARWLEASSAIAYCAKKTRSS